MECRACGFLNPEGMRFCGSCGTPLGQPCGACGEPNPPGFRYCGFCGAPMAAAAPAAPVPAPVHGERRQITVVFCDLVNSTGLASEMDPEELHELIQAYHMACGREIEREGGYVAQHLGDGTMSYFGWPVATEQDAANAVRAALGVLGAIEALNQRMCARFNNKLAVRVGIHTGVVVMGEVGGGPRAEHLALGTVPNVAARLQSMAGPRTLLVSEATHRLIADQFECEDLGPRAVRGLEQPVAVFRVVRERHVPGPREAATRLVGREAELKLLADRWGRVVQGAGQAAVVVGEAGIGKTHLLRGFLAGLEPGFRLVEIRCAGHYQSSAYYPVVDYLRRELSRDVDPQLSERVRQLLAVLEWRGGAAPLDQALTAQQLRERTREALVGLLIEAAERHPLIMLVEDLHWADPSTLELLELLLRPLASAPAMLLVTHRPEFRMAWPALGHLSHLRLGPLRGALVEELVARVAGGRELPREVVRQIVEKTDGVPLFVEELTKMVLETGILVERDGHLELDGPLPPLAIPATLQDSLQARLDRLAATKEVAQIGAVIGREFSYALLNAVADVDEGALQRSLARLVEAELVEERGAPPEASYAFRHALIQETAYQGMLRGTRQRYHARIAQALTNDFPEVAALHPEILAQHYAEAGLPLEAADEWLRAAHRSLEQSAPREAIAQLREAECCLDTLPAGPERERRETRLYVTLGPALVATRGYMSSEVRDVYQRAHTLANAVDDAHADFFALIGLFASHFVHGELPEAERLAERVLAEARQREGMDAALRLVPAHTAMGCVQLELGRLPAAHQHLREAADRYDRALHAPLMHLTGQDFGVLAQCYDGYALWTLGFPDQAVRSTRAGLALARELEHPHSVGLGLACMVTLHQFRGEPSEALPLVQELAALAERGGFRHWRVHAALYGAWTETRLGDRAGGLERLRQTVADMPHHETRTRQLFACRRLLAEALIEAGLLDEALELVQPVERPGPVAPLWFEPETDRLRGVVLAARGGADAAAEAALLRARELARAQEARMLELRAVVAHCRLLQRMGRAGEVPCLLEPLLASFDEGHDLADLREARAVLAPAATLVV